MNKRIAIFKQSVAVAAIAAAMLLGGCAGDVAPKPAEGAIAVKVPMTGFEQLAGEIVLIRFDSTTADEDAELIETWAAEGTIENLRYVRVASELGAVASDAAADSSSVVTVSDNNYDLARAMKVQARPWYVLLDSHGRMRYSGSVLHADVMADWVDALAVEKTAADDLVSTFGGTPNGPALLQTTRLKNLDGSDITLRDALGNSGLIVLFVDTACPYSQQAVSELPLLCEAFSTLEYAVYIVNIGDDGETVRQFYVDGDRQRDTYTIAYDDSDITQYSWSIDSVPTVFVLDASGAIEYRGPALWVDVVTAAAENSGYRPTQPTPVRGTGYG